MYANKVARNYGIKYERKGVREKAGNCGRKVGKNYA